MEHTVATEQMNSLKVLAETNMKISETRAALQELQEEETSYLIEREKKTTDRINAVIQQSTEALAQAQGNYHEITVLYKTVSDFAGSLVSLHNEFHLMVEQFNKKNELWQQTVATQEKSIAEVKQSIKEDKIRIENDRKSVDRANKKIEQEKAMIESRQAQIKTALEDLNKKQHGE